MKIAKTVLKWIGDFISTYPLTIVLFVLHVIHKNHEIEFIEKIKTVERFTVDAEATIVTGYLLDGQFIFMAFFIVFAIETLAEKYMVKADEHKKVLDEINEKLKIVEEAE